MTKNKKTKAKAPAQAKVIMEVAPPVVAKPAAVAAPQTKAKVEPLPAKPAAPRPPKVRLELSRPGAQSVAVAGSFNSWQPEQASCTSNGAWIKELTIGPGRYEYMFVVDGQWLADPNAREFTPNPFGGQNSVLVVQQ
jgi:1,4-alpha-glucan branching enzyme